LLITKQFYLFYTTRHIAPNELNKRKHQSSPDCHRLVSQVRSEIIYPFSISFPGARLLKDLLYSDRKCAPGQFWSKINNIRIYSRIISGPLTGKSFAISRNICTNKAGPPGCNGVAVLPRVFNQLDHSEYKPNGSNSPFQTVLSYHFANFIPTMWGTYLQNSESAPSLSADTLGADALLVGLDLCGEGLQGEH